MIAHQYKIRQKKKIEEKNKLPFNTKNISLKNTIIKKIDRKTAKKIIVEYEWLGTIPLFTKYFFGIYFIVDDVEYLGGVLIYSDEYSANKQSIWNKYGFENKIILLSRGVCLWWTPKNTASYFISKTTKWLKKNTHYKIITATVDPAAGEIGTIYQSLNWYYVGLMRGNYSKSGNELTRFSVYINGKLRHSRSIRNEFGTIKKDVILKKYPDAIFVPQYRKRRYFYFIGNKKENKSFFNGIKNFIIPYPKKNLNECGIIYMIKNKINSKLYVGQTTRSFNDRLDDYKRGVGANPYITKAFKKYGWDNFEFKIIDTAQNLNELNEKEIYYIKKYCTTNRKLGYNIELGGKNSAASLETRTKLSKARKNIKQSPEWVEKRIVQVSKPVIKYHKTIKYIIEEYPSLADAGKNNGDNLSYTQLCRRCLGMVKQTEDIIWCYKEDAINNSIPQYKSNISGYREYYSFTEKELDNMYNDYKLGVSIRELSDANKINYSTLQKYIKKRDSIKMDVLDGKTTAICKKTKKDFKDIINKSGCLTNHIKEIYPDIKLPSKYLRKKIEYETGKPWYYDYFIFQ